jgi:hypothetical protein
MDDEELEWYALSPAERFAESQKLWEVFLRFGGSLDPEPDTQSPFYSLYFGDKGPADGGTGLHPLRRGGVQP